MTNNLKTQFSTQEYDAQFQVWKKNVWNVNKLKQKCYAKSTLIKKIKEELLYLRQLSANDYELLRKWYELQDFSNKYTPERLSEVYNRIWKPVGYSDFRRVEPELIYVRDKISSQQIDIWGNISEKHWDINDPLSEEWDILRNH